MVNLVVMQQGVVDFACYPNAALAEVAMKQDIHTADRVIIISKIRSRLIHLEGPALESLLHDLREAAVRHGADTAVELTRTM